MAKEIIATQVNFEILGQNYLCYASAGMVVGDLDELKQRIEAIWETAHISQACQVQVNAKDYEYHHYLHGQFKQLEK